ncbi:MAG TPA: DUF6491 family protein [Phenylobacterium sp.]|jgi:hypothetical protein|nr:DUF6491 family protein [Phenylobacterium sp.]
MKLSILATVALAGAAVAFSAAAQPKTPNSCFWTHDLRNHTVGGDHILYFNVGGRDVYKVETTGSCLAGMTSSDPIVLRDRASTGQICNKLDLDISVRGAPCIVSSLTKLTPAEVAAIPRRMKP